MKTFLKISVLSASGGGIGYLLNQRLQIDQAKWNLIQTEQDAIKEKRKLLKEIIET